MVWWASDNAKSPGTGTACHGLVNIGRVMCRQVVPNEDAMVIGIHPLHPKLLNIGTYVIAKITKDICSCPNAMHAPNPTTRTLHTSEDMQGEPWVPRLNCKNNSDLRPMVIMPIFTYPKNPQGPPTCAVALLHRHTELINVDELAPGHLKNTNRGGEFQKLHTRN